MAPWVSPGDIANAMFEEIIYSWNAVETTCGIACPPNSSGAESVPQPDSTNWSYAALNPAGVVTLPSSWRVQPSASPDWLIGNSTSATNLPPSSSTASTTSGEIGKAHV